MVLGHGSTLPPRLLLPVLLLALALPGPVRSGTFSNLGVHPDAALQPTATGRTLVTLRPWSGKLYAGFGDYTANTGPIAIRAFDAAGGFGPVLLRQATEAVYLYREVGGKLLAPHTDPIAGESTGGFAEGIVSVPDDRFTDRLLVTGVHLYDVATFDGTDLWLAGSKGSAAALWRSTDGGLTFPDAPVLELAPPTGFSRFYFIAVHAGSLHVQASGFDASKVFDGTAFRDGPDLVPDGGVGWHPESFAGELVYQADHAGLGASLLMRFDGAAARPLLARRVYDFSVDGGALFALTARFVPVPGSSSGGYYEPDAIVQTEDLCTWTEVAPAPPDARSLAVLAGSLYVGSREAVLQRHDEPVTPTVVAAPPGEVRPLYAVQQGGDVVLAWSSLLAPGSCLRYSVLVADAPPAASLSDFTTLSTGLDALGLRHVGAAADPGFHAYLVYAESPEGAGPTGR